MALPEWKRCDPIQPQRARRSLPDMAPGSPHDDRQSSIRGSPASVPSHPDDQAAWGKQGKSAHSAQAAHPSRSITGKSRQSALRPRSGTARSRARSERPHGQSWCAAQRPLRRCTRSRTDSSHRDRHRPRRPTRRSPPPTRPSRSSGSASSKPPAASSPARSTGSPNVWKRRITRRNRTRARNRSQDRHPAAARNRAEDPSAQAAADHPVDAVSAVEEAGRELARCRRRSDRPTPRCRPSPNRNACGRCSATASTSPPRTTSSRCRSTTSPSSTPAPTGSTTNSARPIRSPSRWDWSSSTAN